MQGKIRRKINERAFRLFFTGYHSPYAKLVQRLGLYSLEIEEIIFPTTVSELLKER